MSASTPKPVDDLTGFEAQVLAAIDPEEITALLQALDPPAQRLPARRLPRRDTGRGRQAGARQVPYEILCTPGTPGQPVRRLWAHPTTSRA